MATNAYIAQIEQKLRGSLKIETIQIVDESHLHIGHAGAASGGGHFQLTITSKDFDGLSMVARHRLIYDALGDAIGTDIHALSIKAYGTDEH